MKKTYQSPETVLTDLELQQMIAGSNNYGEPEKGQDLGAAEETSATSGNLSRRRSVWGDEEEFEDEQF